MRLKTGRHSQESSKTLQEQSGAQKKNQRNRDLRYHQNVNRSVLPDSGACPMYCLLQHLIRHMASEPKRGKDAEEKTGKQGGYGKDD